MDDRDNQDWRTEMQNIKPLKQKNISIDRHIESPKYIYHQQAESEINLPIQNQNFKYIELNDSSYLDKNLAKKLRNGQLRIEATLDLHGYFQDNALDKLIVFIQQSYHGNKRCVKIITGKGKDAPTEFGALYQNVPRWLNLDIIRPYILMFCHAQPKDGGNGALYILLRKNR